MTAFAGLKSRIMVAGAPGSDQANFGVYGQAGGLNGYRNDTSGNEFTYGGLRRYTNCRRSIIFRSKYIWNPTN